MDCYLYYIIIIHCCLQKLFTCLIFCRSNFCIPKMFKYLYCVFTIFPFSKLLVHFLLFQKCSYLQFFCMFTKFLNFQFFNFLYLQTCSSIFASLRTFCLAKFFHPNFQFVHLQTSTSKCILYAQKCFPNFLPLYDLVSINMFFYFRIFNLLKVLYTCTYTSMHICEHNQFSSTCHVISFVFLSLRTVYILDFNFEVHMTHTANAGIRIFSEWTSFWGQVCAW